MAKEEGTVELRAPKGPLNADEMLDLLISSANLLNVAGNGAWSEIEATVKGQKIKVRVTVS